MRIYIDADSRLPYLDAGFSTAMSGITHRRGDDEWIEVRFGRRGRVIDLPDAASGIYGAKAAGDHAGDFWLQSDAWQKLGSGASAAYCFRVPIRTVPVDAFFDDDPAPASLTLMGAIQWIESGRVRETPKFAVTIEHDVIRGAESHPLTPDYPTEYPPVWHVPNVRLDITGLTGGGADKLDGQATVSIDLATAPRLWLIRTGPGGALQGYILTPGTLAEDPPLIVRPDDYAPSTNEKYWIQAL